MLEFSLVTCMLMICMLLCVESMTMYYRKMKAGDISIATFMLSFFLIVDQVTNISSCTTDFMPIIPNNDVRLCFSRAVYF